jgi:DNA-directed RNA polymerase subunit RPC12/RpoP
MKSYYENSDGVKNQSAMRQMDLEVGHAAILDLGHAKSKDAHCTQCGFKLVGGANVGLCPRCGSQRWYKTSLI